MKVDVILQLYSASKSSDIKWKPVKVKPLDTLAIIDEYTPFILLDKVHNIDSHYAEPTADEVNAIAIFLISNCKATAMPILACVS
jgi:hypothetical protein